MLSTQNYCFVCRYCKQLVQEFAVKVDQGFLLAVLWLFDLSAPVEESHRLAAFRSDCELVDRSLMDDMVHATADIVKSFYDMLHISPFKVCIHPEFMLLH